MKERIVTTMNPPPPTFKKENWKTFKYYGIFLYVDWQQEGNNCVCTQFLTKGQVHFFKIHLTKAATTFNLSPLVFHTHKKEEGTDPAELFIYSYQNGFLVNRKKKNK